MSAKCTVCGKVFEGEDCVKKAEEHEKIEVIQPLFEIGDIALVVKLNLDNYGSTLSIRGYNIEEDIVVAAVDIAATFMFTLCKIPHERFYRQYENKNA